VKQSSPLSEIFPRFTAFNHRPPSNHLHSINTSECETEELGTGHGTLGICLKRLMWIEVKRGRASRNYQICIRFPADRYILVPIDKQEPPCVAIAFNTSTGMPFKLQTVQMDRRRCLYMEVRCRVFGQL